VAEVARSLDLAEDAVKQRLSRGRLMLREELNFIPPDPLRFKIHRGAIAPWWSLFMLSARERLKYSHAVALGVGERDILPDAGDLHRPAQHLPACLDHFLSWLA
jgi:hypothetical protein